MSRRDRGVVAAVTGIGVVSPAGCHPDDLWDALVAGRPTARRLTDPEAARLPVHIACTVSEDFEVESRVGAREARRLDRFSQFAVAAALDAVDDAALGAVDADRAAVIAGSSLGGAGTMTEQGKRYFTQYPAKPIHPFTMPLLMQNAAPAAVALQLGWRGPNLSVATACAAGAHALGEGLRLLQEGAADVVLAGGTEAPVTPFILLAFSSLRALSARNDDPAGASRPFAADRDGFVLGEGAAFCVLERADAAAARGARVYALLTGYGRNTDAYHLVMPAPDGAGAARCMELALADAGLTPADVANVNAHGTSTPLNDAAEAAAITAVFGPAGPSVTAPKGVTGHLISGAGALEAVASCLTLHHQLVPPVANLDKPDPELAIDAVCDGPRPLGHGAVLSNSFAFGGHNASLVFEPMGGLR